MTIEWLRDIEQKVEAAAEELTKLRRSEKSLRAQVRRLEKELQNRQEDDQASQDWRKMRTLIRTRVEMLVDGLERLDNG